jgi:Ycf4
LDELTIALRLNMTAQATAKDSTIFRQEILGSRRFSNLWWATISSMGGIGFLLAGLSSYLKVNLLLVSDPRGLQFVPQGIALLFYGVAGSLIALYLWLIALWDLGGGYNEFNKETGKVKIFRWGFPGKNRRIELEFPIEDVIAVKADIREGLNPKRELYLRVKQRRDIPLTRVGQPIALSALENQGAELARFLTVPLEGL